MFSAPGQAAKSQPASPAKSVDGDEMVQDPVCKVYVPASTAISRKVGGETQYFCSEDCAGKYVKELH